MKFDLWKSLGTAHKQEARLGKVTHDVDHADFLRNILVLAHFLYLFQYILLIVERLLNELSIFGSDRIHFLHSQLTSFATICFLEGPTRLDRYWGELGRDRLR